MIGRWIDGLTDEQRDRIVQAQGWWNPRVIRRGEDARCLVQIVYNLEGIVEALLRHRRLAEKYDHLVVRFGLARVVRAIKARAAAVRSSEVEREPAHV